MHTITLLLVITNVDVDRPVLEANERDIIPFVAPITRNLKL